MRIDPVLHEIDRGNSSHLEDHYSYPESSSTLSDAEILLAQPISDWDSTTLPLNELRAVRIELIL